MNSISKTPNDAESKIVGLQSEIDTILRSNHDVVFLADSNGMTQKVSEACERLCGLKPKDLVGRSVFDLEKDGVFKPSVTRAVLKTGRRIQSLQLTQTGKELLVVGTPIRNESGGIGRVVNLSWNIPPGMGSLTGEHSAARLFSVYNRADVFAAKDLNRLVYVSDSMARAAELALKVSEVDSTALIIGEPGTGKEVIASFIHSNSSRGGRPFLKVNCAALTDHFLECELFGYEKGGFVGANEEGKPGMFELAERGTLFLDEVSELSRNMQVKLLRVLQEGTFTRMGGVRNATADVRVIAATNKDLATEMLEGRFRQDLFYMLNVLPIHIPPLRERLDDIPLLALFFLRHYNERHDKNKIFDPRTITHLQEHNWRGNVRELQHMVERLVILTEEDMIVPLDLKLI